MAQVRPNGCCWGNLVGRNGWTGDKFFLMGYCDGKPRKGKLTCWSHRAQEYDAQRLKQKQEKQ